MDLAAYFLDADLSILCEDEPIYDQYAERIWLEYAFVGRETYCAKRPAVLQKLCAVNPYFTAGMRAQFETRALPNVQREIARLQS